jgi:hypothetical protein
MEWIAQFYSHDNDDGNRPLIKIGIKQDRLWWLYFDFDIENPDGCEDSKIWNIRDRLLRGVLSGEKYRIRRYLK